MTADAGNNRRQPLPKLLQQLLLYPPIVMNDSMFETTAPSEAQQTAKIIQYEFVRR